MRKAFFPYSEKSGRWIRKADAVLDRLRRRVPGLPPNRVLLAAAGLILAAAAIFVILQARLAPDQRVTTYALPYTQNFDEVDLKRWYSTTGVWTIREGALLQTVGGEQIGQVHIPLKVPPDAAYHASVFITLRKDSRQAGLSFNAQYPELGRKQHRVYIDRVNSDRLELVAGYIDETGAFLTQARVPLTLNTTEFRLDVYVFNTTYLVQVNGQRLIENRPVFYEDGMLGFHALGPAAFDTFKVTAAENQDPADMVYTSDFDSEPGGAGWVPISGSWQIVEGRMRQQDPAIHDAAIGYEAGSFENYTLRAAFHHLQGQGAGVLFNMPSPYQVNGAQLVRYSDETDALIWGYFDAQGVFQRQGYLEVAPAADGEHVLQIFSGADAFDLLLDGETVARSVPLLSAQGTIGLTTSRASAGFSQVEVYPLFAASADPLALSTPRLPTQTSRPAATKTLHPVETAPTASVLVTIDPSRVVSGGASPYRGYFDGSLADSGWQVLGGEWDFQDGNFVQDKVDGFDFAAVYSVQAFRDYSFQAGFRQERGSGAGLVFNLPQPDRLAGASMVRYSERRDNAIVWGYFDETGVYQNQGYADVPNAGTDRHTLRVVSGDTSYGIRLDGRLIVGSVPYGPARDHGYLGLITSRSRVAYDEVVVDGVDAAFAGTYSEMDGFSNARVISGKWTFDGNAAAQSVTAPADYVWNTGVQGSVYTIRARIRLAEGSDSGGGFVIHMSDRGSKADSYMVRFKDGGQAVWWGSIDEQGRFQGRGSAAVEAAGSAAVLELEVKRDRVTVRVDGQELARDVAIPSQQGWIGLLSFGGPVTFEDVILELDE